MSKSIVIGLGEIGQPLFEILRETYPDVWGYDIKNPEAELPKNAEILNICIPWSDSFISTVQHYQQVFGSRLTIIHSTVPVGTTNQLIDAVNSPVLGRHKNMKEEMIRYRKWIGGALANEGQDFLSRAGFNCQITENSRHTELMKLMCLAKYGVSLAFANYQKQICEKEGLPFALTLEWDEDYNANVGNLKRPLIDPDGAIGGHCVVPGTKLLNKEFPNRLLKEVLTYE